MPASNVWAPIESAGMIPVNETKIMHYIAAAKDQNILVAQFPECYANCKVFRGRCLGVNAELKHRNIRIWKQAA